MLHWWYNSRGRFLRTLECGALAGLLYLWFALPALRAQLWDRALPLTLLFAFYLVLRGCASWRWYPRPTTYTVTQPDLGIEWHFRRSLVVGIYGLALGVVWTGLGAPPRALWCLFPVTGLFTYANGILLYFYWCDPDTTPVNYYSARPRSKAHLHTSAATLESSADFDARIAKAR